MISLRASTTYFLTFFEGGTPAYTEFQKKNRFFWGSQNLSRVDDQSTNEFLILPTPQISGFLADFDFSKLSRHCRDSVATKSEKVIFHSTKDIQLTSKYCVR